MTGNSVRSFVPLYYRIEQEILEQIKLGQLKPGDQLASENDLVKQFGVSRITVRRVLTDLVNQGLAYRQQGRGTFVALSKVREISGFRSFTEDVLARGMRPSSLVLLFEAIDPEPAIRERLHIEASDRAFHLKRVRLVNEEPVAIETVYIPTRVCPGLLNEDLASGSLYGILRDKYNVIPAWADAEIEAAPATGEAVQYLGLKVGAPVLVARRMTYSDSFAVIETVHSIYRGDRFSFFTGRQLIS